MPSKSSASSKPDRGERLTEYRRKRSFAETPEPPGDAPPAPPSTPAPPEPSSASAPTLPAATPGRAGHASARSGSPAGSPSPSRASAPSGSPAGSPSSSRSLRSRSARAAAAHPRFVVHEHHATRLHWDLRLERDGVLASWAIPNGIPDDPKHNRKAIHVEDHPLDYLDFAGTIPKGQYGAGQVSVWDRGTYSCQKWRSDEVIITFAGERLRGRYALFHAGRAEKDWMIHRMDPPLDPSAEPMPEFVQPMLARLSTLPADDRNWAFEVKWDGVRMIACSRPGRIRLWSRNRNDATVVYTELRALNRALGSHSAILDGEIVAFAGDGRPSFELLQTRMHVRGDAQVRRLAKSTPVTYVLFDLLWLDGHSTMGLPFRERRELLARLVPDGERWSVPEYHVGDGAAFLAATREQGLEGIVAKRLDSRYLPGRRDAGWLKVKNANRQEAVIGGYTTGKGARAATIGALHLGVYEWDALRYAGKVGTGFDDTELARLAGLLKGLRRKDSPFVGAQPPRGAHFVEPTLVCEVQFGSWTKDGILRHSVYKGLREDRDPTEVVRERVATVHRAAHRAPTEGDNEAGPGHDRRAPGAPPPNSDAITTALAKLLEGAHKTSGGTEVQCEGRKLKLTNLDKVLYPKTGFTKGDLIGYYVSVAPALLAHLQGRPLTLKRYPDGVDGKSFYEKHCPAHRPKWVRTVPVWSGVGGREVQYCLCEDLPTLVWLANLAAIELHPSLSRAKKLERPSAIAFDLDPGAPAGIVECCRVALQLRELFAELGLECYPKTSGSKGVQVYVPLNSARVEYEQTKPFAHAVAEVLEGRHPELVVSRMAKARRRGKVLIDWSQNDEHKTTVAAYSLRARPAPSASTPLQWEEVERCERAGDAAVLAVDPRELPARLAERGDLFAPVETRRQRLPKLDA
jgi:bifunctional non-homologous end joining protein LigD